MIKKLTLGFFIYLFSLNAYSESAREYFKFAKFSYDTQDYTRALDFINKAIEVDPTYVNGFLLRAEIHFRLGEFSKVVNDITLAFNLDENANKTLAEFHLLRGRAYHNMNDLNDAISDIDYSLKLNPSNANAYFLKGIINMEESNYFEALENLDKAIKFDADESEYYFKRAELKKIHYKPLAGTKTYENIMTDIKLSIALNPEDYRPYLLKCEMLKLDQGVKKDYLKSVLDEIIEHFPEQAEFYAERGMTNVLTFNYSSAVLDFTKAIELDEFNEANYRNRGLCLHNMKRYYEAIKDYTSSIEIMVRKYQSANYPESIKKILAQTLTMRGMTHDFNGNADQACDDYYNAAKLGSKIGLNNYRKNCNVYN